MKNNQLALPRTSSGVDRDAMAITPKVQGEIFKITIGCVLYALSVVLFLFLSHGMPVAIHLTCSPVL